MPLIVLRVPLGWAVVERGRSVVQCSPIEGPDWATVSVVEMAEGWILGLDTEMLSSMASVSGDFVASSGSDMLDI